MTAALHGFHQILSTVMPGFVPGIDAFVSKQNRKDVDGRDKPGHDEVPALSISPRVPAAGTVLEFLVSIPWRLRSN
jgi:hypothetical protein